MTSGRVVSSAAPLTRSVSRMPGTMNSSPACGFSTMLRSESRRRLPLTSGIASRPSSEHAAEARRAAARRDVAAARPAPAVASSANGDSAISSRQCSSRWSICLRSVALERLAVDLAERRRARDRVLVHAPVWHRAPTIYPRGVPQPALTEPFEIGGVRDPQPRRARAAGRDRQLVRAPAGQALRGRAGGQRDGLELRDPPPQREDADRAAARRARGARRRAGRDPALRPGAGGHALRRRDGRRARRGHHRPQHGLPRAEGLQDRRRRGADQGPGHRRRGRARGARGQRPAGHREAALRREDGGDRRLRSSPAGSSTRPASRRSPSTRARRRSITRARPTTSSRRASCRSCRCP